MALKITSVGDVLKKQVAESLKMPTIWVDKRGNTHEDYERVDINAMTLDDEDGNMCDHIVQVGTHVTTVRCIDGLSTRHRRTEIDLDIFKYAINVEQLHACFNSQDIKHIPEGLFKNCRKLYIAAYVFSECKFLEDVPSDLFVNCPLLQDVEGCFSGCTNLRGWNIPGDLFKNNPELKWLDGLFSRCTSLKKVNSEWFSYAPKAERFNDTFSGAWISELPEDLFKNNSKAYGFKNTFNGTTVRSEISNDLFSPLDLSAPEYYFSLCFDRCLSGGYPLCDESPIDTFKKRAEKVGYTGRIFD